MTATGTPTPTLPTAPPAPPRAPRRTRIGFGALALVLVAGGTIAWQLSEEAPPPEPVPIAPKQFHSRPTIDPDTLTVATPAADGVARGSIFLAVKRGPGQDGPMIVDDRGRPIWFRPVTGDKTATAFQVQRYRGRPVLTWWEGNTHLGHGHGVYVVMDNHYRVLRRVRTVASELGDHHDFQLTPRGTALMTLYVERPADLTSVGGPADGTVVDARIQEVDVASGRLLWEWRAADHFAVAEGMTAPKEGKPHDFFHVNSIEETPDGRRVIVSARNMHAVYEIDKASGRVLWKLGGRDSDFKQSRRARFAFQHDARLQPDGTLTLFDNEATPQKAEQSRLLRLRLDRRARAARVVRVWKHPDRLLAGAEGNVQTLPNGDVFASYGPEERVSEFSRDGRLLLDLALPAGADSYQAFRFPWRGRPLDKPAVAARRRGERRTTVWASWNGATLVRRWRVLAGPKRGELKPIGRPIRRSGFETALRVGTKARFVAVRAIGPNGRPLRASRAIEPRGS